MVGEQALMRCLRRLSQRNDRAALATLRHGLCDAGAEAVVACPQVARFVPLSEVEAGDDARYYQVAALFALHPHDTDHGNMGESLRAITFVRSREARFRALLQCSRREVTAHLHDAVRLVAREGVAVNYTQLLYDLRDWDDPATPVQQAWARRYWRPMMEDDAASSIPTAAE